MVSSTISIWSYKRSMPPRKAPPGDMHPQGHQRKFALRATTPELTCLQEDRFQCPGIHNNGKLGWVRVITEYNDVSVSVLGPASTTSTPPRRGHGHLRFDRGFGHGDGHQRDRWCPALPNCRGDHARCRVLHPGRDEVCGDCWSWC